MARPFPQMLSARRKSDGQTVTAYAESKANAPFYCLVCGDEVALKTARHRINHFAHVNPLARQYAENESDAHRRCKMEIYEALSRQSGVRNVALERPLDNVRPDVSAVINGVPVAIEVQISSLSPETIQRRTIESRGTEFMSSGFCSGRRSSTLDVTSPVCGKSGYRA